MSGHKKRALLARDIAAALHSGAGQWLENGSPLPRKLLLAGIALSALQPASASALALGELNVQSALGEPFMATTTARMNAGEALTSTCLTAVSSSVGNGGNGTPLNVAVRGATTPGEFPVKITSAQPLYEPMYEITVQVSCPGTMQLTRNFMVLLNLPMTSPQADLVETAATPAAAPPAVSTATQVAPTPEPVVQPVAAASAEPTAEPTTVQSGTSVWLPVEQPAAAPAARSANPIPAGIEYRVQAGDTLAAIARRIEGRTAGSTWQIAAQIHDDNPAAFIDGNPDLIQLGFVLRIPDSRTLAEITGRAPLDFAAPAPTPSTSESVAAAAPEPVREPAPATLAARPAEQLAPTPEVQEQPAAPELAADEPVAEPAIAEAPVAEPAIAEAPVAEPAAAEIAEAVEPALTETAASAAAIGIVSDEMAVAETPAALATTDGDAPQFMADEIEPAATDDPVRLPTESGAITRLGADVAAEAARQPAAPRAERAPAPSATVATTTDSGTLPLVSIGIGILIACLLAALYLGRGFIVNLLPGRSGSKSKDIFADLPDTPEDAEQSAYAESEFAGETVAMPPREPKPVPEAQPVAAKTTEPAPVAEPVAELPPKPKPAPEPLPEVAAESTDLEFDLADEVHTATDIDLDIGHLVGDGETPLDLNLGDDASGLIDDDSPTAVATADVNLGDLGDASDLDTDIVDLDLGELDLGDIGDIEDPLEDTEKYSAELAAKLVESEDDMENTGTMRNLFDPEDLKESPKAEATGSYTMTKELPRFDEAALDRVDIDATSDLETLSKAVDGDEGNDPLAKTLTQALGLLEQDYEDELTASQVIDRKDVENALAAHTDKKP